jgi:hypothetical protein
MSTGLESTDSSATTLSRDRRQAPYPNFALVRAPWRHRVPIFPQTHYIVCPFWLIDAESPSFSLFA